MTFEVRFWGVRGSIACPSASHIGYGGNTSCVEVMINHELIILDAGTGLRPLGQSMLERKISHATLLFSHTHWDHICGFPFFTPGYIKGNSLDIRAGHLEDEGGIRQALSGQMTQPFFPVPLDTLQAKVSYTDFKMGETFELGGGVVVRTVALNHPNDATGYRIEHHGVSVCYITDIEHGPQGVSEDVIALAKDSDLVIFDSTYTDAQYLKYKGWGHSTWQEGLKLCVKANAKRYAIFHHNPDHDDATMAAIEAEAKQTALTLHQWNGEVFAAKESNAIKLR